MHDKTREEAIKLNIDNIIILQDGDILNMRNEDNKLQNIG